MSNEFVMVPRELLEKVARPRMASINTLECGLVDAAFAKQEICKILDQPAAHQGEPVALPERDVDDIGRFTDGWNACLDEIAKLGPLYSRADTASLQRSWQAGYDTAWYAKNPAEKRTSVNPDDSAEVERLRNRMPACEEIAENNAKAFAEALTKLAERDALLREVISDIGEWAESLDTQDQVDFFSGQLDRLTSSISASAEPSAKQEFRDHLDKCADEVATWPDWKQEALKPSALEKKP